MGVDARMVELQEQHRQLDSEIEVEMQRPGSDTVQVAALKRRKLRLKEEIESLKSSETHH